MGLISLRTADQLYWLGRYVQRALDLLHRLYRVQSGAFGEKERQYKEFCNSLGIDSQFENRQVFLKEFFFQRDNSYSILCSLGRAYDNGVFLRNTIGHESFAYLRLAQNGLESLADVDFYRVKGVIDFIYAFWGSLDESADSRVRAMVRWGKWVEIRDLAGRFEDHDELVLKSVQRLGENLQVLEVSEDYSHDDAADREKGIGYVNGLFNRIYQASV